MSPRVLYLIVGLVLGITGVTKQACVPIDCSDHDAGVKIPDPTNCNRYYICLANGHPSDAVFVCPEGQKFDTNTSACVDSAGTYTCGVCPPACKYSCGNNTDIFAIADPTDCKKYFLCGVLPTPVALECDPSTTDLYFNGEECQSDQSECCDSCAVYCDTAFTEIADPTNCKNYYFCSAAGYYPEADDLHTCPEGENYSSADGTCSASAECVQPCAAAALDG
nr:peritrophin-48-like [Procambarus clarkii]